METVYEPFEVFLGVVRTISSTLSTSIGFLNAFVEFVTRTSFCSYRKYLISKQIGLPDLDLLEYFNRMQEWIKGLVTKVGKAVGSLRSLRRYLSVLNSFKRLMNNCLFKAFKKFRSILKEVTGFADVLDFLNTLAKFEICYALPEGCTKEVDLGPLGTAKIPWICWGNKKCTGLEDIGKFMAKIERIIRSIPGVGELWGLVEKFVTTVLGELFAFVGNLLPSFR